MEKIIVTLKGELPFITTLQRTVGKSEEIILHSKTFRGEVAGTLGKPAPADRIRFKVEEVVIQSSNDRPYFFQLPTPIQIDIVWSKVEAIQDVQQEVSS